MQRGGDSIIYFLCGVAPIHSNWIYCSGMDGIGWEQKQKKVDKHQCDIHWCFFLNIQSKVNWCHLLQTQHNIFLNIFFFNVATLLRLLRATETTSMMQRLYWYDWAKHRQKISTQYVCKLFILFHNINGQRQWLCIRFRHNNERTIKLLLWKSYFVHFHILIQFNVKRTNWNIRVIESRQINYYVQQQAQWNKCFIVIFHSNCI